MRIQTSFDYAATPEDVFAMLADPEFQAAKVEATHPLPHTESVTPKGEQTEIVTSRVISTDGFPDFAKSMIGPKVRVSETIVWSRGSADGSRTGTIHIAMGDAPVSMSGTLRLAPGGTGTRIDVDGDLKAKIPLVGGKVEKAAEGPILGAIDKEQEVGTAWLAG
jgi:carbon monoxide dehydrogenase subunit G